VAARLIRKCHFGGLRAPARPPNIRGITEQAISARPIRCFRPPRRRAGTPAHRLSDCS